MEKVGEQLPALATTLAGLILVFLGVVFTSWESYETPDKNAVRRKYRIRAWLAFLGFLACLASTAFALIGIGISHKSLALDYLALGAIIVAVALTIAVAVLILLEI